MADGILGLFGGGGNTSDLSQLVRPPDPLSDALAAMSERFAQAGQASRLPTSTLGALGSALGGASTAARTAQTQYLDQAIKLQALKRSLMQMGYDQRTAEFVARKMAQSEAQRPAQPGVAPAVTPMAPPAGAPPPAPAAVPAPTAAPGAPPIAAPSLPGDFGAGGDIPPMGNYGLPPDGGLLSPDTVIPSTQGGAGAAVTPASFRLASLVEPNGRGGNGAGDAEPGSLDLRGLLSLNRAGGADPFAGLLATDARIQPGGPDTLVKSGDQSQLPIERASMSAPRSEAGAGDPLDVIEKYESGGRNVMQGVVPPGGGYNPSTGTVTGPSTAQGYYQITNSTWRDAAPKAGVSLAEYPNAMSAPKDVQRAVAKQLYDEQGYAPWAPYNPRLASAVGYEGGGGRPNVQLAQYAPGQGGAPPLVGPGSGVIPGLGMTPQDVALANTMSILAGHANSPFKEFLDVYYKSPEYLRGATEAQKLGERAVTEPSDIRIAQQKAVEDRVTKQMEQLGSARLSLAPNGILVPDGQGGQTRVQATVEQAVRAANGLPVPELGIKGMYPDTKSSGGAPPGAPGAPGGTPSDTTRPAGPIAGEPVPTAQQKELQTYGTEVFKKEHAAAQTARSTIDSTNELRKLLDDGIISGSGADARRGLLRLGQLVGITGKDENELVANTEAFISESGRNLTAALKGMGPPVSNIDVQVAQGIVGSKDQTVGGLKKILDLVEKNNRRVILEFNKKASMMPQTKEIPSFAVPEPYKYGAPIADGPNGPLWKNDAGKWVPLQ